MSVKAGQPLRLTIQAYNQDGTVQAESLVDMKVIPLAPSATEQYHVTRYRFTITNPQGGQSTVENPVTVNK